MTIDINKLLEDQINQLDQAQLKSTWLDQNEAIVIDDFLPGEILGSLLTCLPEIAPQINRNYIPGHKKGGSISRFDLDKYAPIYRQLYESDVLWKFLESFADRKLLPCPETDPHTYALYYYTEAGDHIGWHYDTSYYQDCRYTLLLGLVDESECVLECQLYKDDDERESKMIDVIVKPGTLVLFNGDKLWHRVTPMGENQRRIVLTNEYLTNVNMSRIGRFVSNMKDSIAYFGFKQVFGK